MTPPSGDHTTDSELQARHRDLRAAAALAHAVPDAVLTLETARAQRTVVSFGSDSQLTPCQLRELLGSGTAMDLVRRTRSIHLGGSFTKAGGGVFERSEDGRREGWFVTSLCAGVVRHLLAECRVPVPPESIEVHLFRDTVLGITVGQMQISSAYDHHMLDVTRRAHAICAVEELVVSVTPDGDPRS